MNHLDRLTSLIWWQNFRGAAETKLETATDRRDQLALLVTIAQADDVITRMGPAIAADARATLARLDAEDAAGAVLS